ncbi:hydroxyacylglutathione hydrolase [Gemmata obscuriglobus]|uniref:Hydroxyacylglutathione hydrolase n=2 Tax=Gemmata obscuriglobus TaxID=114 RepID=A0A2Z3HHI6_9BACT|nr:hydroxyacylglutathione hydrolase [Gemmata obscuriglobus]
MVAAHLLRTARLRVVMVNRSGAMARGVAYGTNSPSHLLNVPAGRMSALPNDPEHFLRFVRQSDPGASPGAFVRRSVYGEYLQHILAEAEHAAGAGALGRVVGEAVSVVPGFDGVRVTTAAGEELRADRVVLAIGHYPPAPPPGVPRTFLDSQRYVRDPWAAGALAAVPRDQPALLVGTGLTAADVALDLHAAGLPGAIAVSRRGLLPRPHDPSVPAPDSSHVPSGMGDGPRSLRAHVRAVRRCVREVTTGGGNWRQVIDALRPYTPRLWQSLGTADRHRFFRHLRPYWDAHRHRLAPAAGAAIDDLVASGWLAVCAGRFTRFDEHPSGVEVAFAPKGGGAERTVRVGAVVNCTGPATNALGAGDPLLADLLARGAARPDPLGLGIEVAPDGAVVGADGAPSSVLYYVGPFLRARDGEGTAVPELRAHAARTAGAVAAGLPVA